MRYIFTVLSLFITTLILGQSPAKVNYQGIARNAAGIPLANQNISIKFEILQGSSSGSVIYSDTQAETVTTNEFGLFSTQIGNNGNLAQVNWTGGPYFLRVLMDVSGGSNLVSVGTPQQFVSVPYAWRAETVPSTYNNNVLTIGTQTHFINTTPVTITQGTGTNVTVSGGPNYTINSVVPSLSISSNSLSIEGGNTVTLPVAATPTLVAAGIASVNNGASTYTVGVPAPSYNPNGGQLSFGATNVQVTPTLVLSGGVLYSGTPTNSVGLPTGVTVSGTGLAQVTGFPNYVVNVNPPVLALSPNNLSISIVGSNSVALPAAVTVTTNTNGALNVTGGPTNYTIDMSAPVYTGTNLIVGNFTTQVAPSLSLTSGILSSGPASNSVNIGTLGPWKQSVSTVTLTNTSDNVAIGLTSASAKLDVFSNTTSGSVIKANNASSTNTSAAVDISSQGGKALYVYNNSSNGIGGDFSSTGGYAITAQNNSNTFPTFQAQNTNASNSALAGYFDGGLAVRGNGATNANFALKVNNSSSADLISVRNDGNVGIGNSTPTEKLDVTGSIRMNDGNQANGKIAMSDLTGKAAWRSSPTALQFAGLNNASYAVTSTTTAVGPSMTFNKIYDATDVEITMHSRVYAGSFSGASFIIFEIYVDGLIATATSQHMMGNNVTEYVHLTSYFSGQLAAGSHTITIVAKTDSGSSTGVTLDPGGFNGKVLVKEHF